MNNYSRNRHLNFYQFFSQSEEIENNLTRALALCLQNNPLFFKTFVGELIGQHTLEKLLGYIEEEETVEINIQERTANIRARKEDISKLFGVALTSEPITFELGSDFRPTENPGASVTDVFIRIKDIAIIIEAKPHGEDCSAQLRKQLEECDMKVEKTQSITWEQVLEMLITTNHLHQLLGGSSVFIRDFIQLIETHYVDWLPVLPFSQLPFPKSADGRHFSKHYKRLEQIKNAMGVELLEFRDRTPIPINVNWASEVMPYFTRKENQNLLCVYVWPGSIKGQGWSLYSKDQKWQEQKTLEVDTYSFPLRVIPEIVFRHFNGFVSQIKLPEGPSTLHNYKNFEERSGKWPREKWLDLEHWLDQELGAGWRSDCQWTEKFLETDRTYLTLSLGFEVVVEVPYELLEKLDRRKDNPEPVAELLRNLVRALEELIE